MPTIWLDRAGLAQEDLPPVCMACGQPAEHHVRRQFSWIPGWTYLLLFVHILVFLIVALLLRQTQKVQVPLCARHRSYFAWRLWFTILSFLGVILAAVAFAVGGADLLDIPHSDRFGFTAIILVAGLFLWLITVAILQTNSIRSSEFTAERIKLVGVSRAFIEAYERSRQPIRALVDESARERWADRQKSHREESTPHSAHVQPGSGGEEGIARPEA